MRPQQMAIVISEVTNEANIGLPVVTEYGTLVTEVHDADSEQ